ncbi:MAG: VanW family protein [Clostridia bacterium]|nr:VanW family protein [Clostridia bacterium]
MEKIEKNNEKRRKESLYNDETNNIIKNGNNDIKKTAKRENNNEDVPSRKPKNKVEERDTTGDTKVFQVIRKEDIEREKRKQAIKQENIVNKQNISTKHIQKTNEIIKTTKTPDTNNKKIEQPKLNNYQQKNNNSNLNNYNKNNNNKNNSNRNKRSILIALLIIILIILAITIISTIFGLLNVNSNKIVKGVKVNGIEVSKLTKEEANQRLEEQLNNNEINVITIKYGDYIRNVKLEEIEGHFDVQNAVENAYNIGRESDIVQNNYNIIGTMITGNNINTSFTYNEELLENKINEISLELPGLALEASYIIEGDKLIIKNGTDGLQIQNHQFKENTINSFAGTEKTFEIPVEHAEKKEIDIEKIHNEIYKEPKDAYYTINPRQIYKEEYGLDFAISVEEAKQLISEDKPEYVIQLKNMEPKVKVSNLDKGAFPDKLSAFTTYYGTADTARNTNIALAAKSINSVVVMPGETFSYNDLIGECSTRTGYKQSTIYLNGELSTGIGGGICQVSTTLYNSVLRANLEIVERRNHSLGVTYVPAGHDAMVSIGSSDFKFKNNRDYPVKVVAYVGTGNVTCEIHGLKQATEYEVKLESKTTQKTDKKYKVETYKVLYLNGNVVSRTWLSTDTYKYHQ